MKEVIVKNLVLGSGLPKICIPLTGRTEKELTEQMNLVLKAEPDLVEWRADYFVNIDKRELLHKTGRELSALLGQIPMIFTIRTQNEGGELNISMENYVNLLRDVADQDYGDIIDVEIMMKGLEGKNLIINIQESGKKVIASNHHFHETPQKDEMKRILTHMENEGADIRKLAVMPKCNQDVLDLMEITCQSSEEGNQPVVTMAMGEKGKISRVSGNFTGSCMTFATAGKASAPGQLSVEDVKYILKCM